VPGEARGTPAVGDEAVYFLSRQHALVALDMRNGRRRWSAALGAGDGETLGTRVVVGDGIVVAGDGDLYGIRQSDGTRRWRAALHGGFSGMYLGGAAGGLVFAGSVIGQLAAFDISSGLERWRIRVGPAATTVFPPVVRDGQVVAQFASSEPPVTGGLISVDDRTGAERWRWRLPPVGRDAGGMAAAGEPVVTPDLAVMAGSDGTIHAIDRETGLARWAIPDPDHRAGEPDFRPLARLGRVLVAGSLTGRVVAYDLATRRERWRRVLGWSSVAFGVAADDRFVYVPLLSGRLAALRPGDGTLVWETSRAPGGFRWTPLSSGGRVFAGSSAGGFFALARHPAGVPWE
jgi:outer membrane protein assembly factor BamB